MATSYSIPPDFFTKGLPQGFLEELEKGQIQRPHLVDRPKDWGKDDTVEELCMKVRTGLLLAQLAQLPSPPKHKPGAQRK